MTQMTRVTQATQTTQTTQTTQATQTRSRPASLPPELGEPLARAWPQLESFVTSVRWYPTVSSTMDVASQAAALPDAHGLVVVADEQTAGRGRRGRAWISTAGSGLYFSVLLQPPVDASSPSRPGPSVVGLLTLAAGVAVGEGVTASTGLATTLKWPNDVFVGKRKVAGILAEALAPGGAPHTVVLGVGINIADTAYPPDVAARATSLGRELGRAVDRGELLTSVLVSLARRYRHLLEARYDEVLEAWRSSAPAATGANVEWDSLEGVSRGVTAGIDDTGALLVGTEGTIERIISGEIRWS